MFWGNARSTAGLHWCHWSPRAAGTFSLFFSHFLTTDNWCFRCSGDWPPRQVLVQCNMSRRSWTRGIWNGVPAAWAAHSWTLLHPIKILLNARLNGLFGAAFYPHCVVHISYIYMIIYIDIYSIYIYIIQLIRVVLCCTNVVLVQRHLIEHRCWTWQRMKPRFNVGGALPWGTQWFTENWEIKCTDY